VDISNRLKLAEVVVDSKKWRSHLEMHPLVVNMMVDMMKSLPLMNLLEEDLLLEAHLLEMITMITMVVDVVLLLVVNVLLLPLAEMVEMFLLRPRVVVVVVVINNVSILMMMDVGEHHHVALIVEIVTIDLELDNCCKTNKNSFAKNTTSVVLMNTNLWKIIDIGFFFFSV
jgi:hypothetical protein